MAKENIYHNSAIDSLYFSLGAAAGYSFNGMYSGLTFNYQTGAHLQTSDDFMSHFMGKVAAPPVIVAPSYNQGIVHMKEVTFTHDSIPKVEHASEYAHQGDYAVYGWYKWDSSIE